MTLITDFSVQDGRSIYILIPNTDKASDWIAEHIPDDATTWGRGIVVDHRYIRAIVAGIVEDGLSVEFGLSVELVGG